MSTYGTYLVAPDFYYKNLNDISGGLNDIQMSYSVVGTAPQTMSLVISGQIQMSINGAGAMRTVQRRKFFPGTPTGTLFSGTLSDNGCASIFSGYSLIENASNPSFHDGRQLTIYTDYGNNDYIAVANVDTGEIVNEYRNGASNVTVSGFANQTNESIFDYLTAGNFPTGISAESSDVIDPLVSRNVNVIINPTGTCNITSTYNTVGGQVINDSTGNPMMVGMVVETLATPITSTEFAGVVYTKKRTVYQYVTTVDGFWIPGGELIKHVTYHTADYAVFLQGILSIMMYSNNNEPVLYKDAPLIDEPFINLGTLIDPDDRPA